MDTPTGLFAGQKRLAHVGRADFTTSTGAHDGTWGTYNHIEPFGRERLRFLTGVIKPILR